MGQALFISNNQVLNDIYEVNLDAYLGLNVTVKNNVPEALKLLELDPSIDLIVCLCLIEGRDAALEISRFLEKNELETPLVVLGRQSDIEESLQYHILPASYNVKSVVKTSAKLLEVTPRSMMDKVIPNYYPIPVRIFSHFGVVTTDVFFRVKNGLDSEYIKIFKNGSEISGGVGKYIDEGVQNLYVNSLDRLTFVNRASSIILESLESEEIEIERKIEVVEQGFEVIADQLFENPEITQEMADISNACIGAMTDIIKEVPRFDKLLQSLLDNQSGYVYTHSILTTFVASHIVKNISWGGESHIEKLSFVLFFHDMFLVPIYNRYPNAKREEDLVAGEMLNSKEKEIVLHHARLAGEAVRRFPRSPLGADAIITQHHGFSNGEGFSTKYKDDLSPLAKVIIVSECFSEEVINFFDETSVDPFDKLGFIDKLYKKFPFQSYQKIIDTLKSIDI